ncbi:CHAT domain-containing protein [Streptosporangiaceae bacterium NEAU-GS5]|nr:CHAT domain-containing protein [Streptosporangiaceae bacterium NEAU-GS5]
MSARFEEELAAGTVVVHTAAYGVYQMATPMMSGPVLADGTLTAERITGMRFDGALVALCACQSGAAMPYAGKSGSASRARACTRARDVVVGYWSIDDLSMSLLTRHLHDALQAGDGRGRGRAASVQGVAACTGRRCADGFAAPGRGRAGSERQVVR